MNDNSLLASALSALVHSKVYLPVPDNSVNGDSFLPLDVDKLHVSMFTTGRVNTKQPTDVDIDKMGNDLTIFIASPLGGKIELNVGSSDQVECIKLKYSILKEIPTSKFILNYCGRKLENHKLISDYNIESYSTVHVFPLKEEIPINYVLNLNSLDGQFNYDFTKIRDNKTFSRGNQIYIRPCGYFRFGIKVVGKYRDGENWLGCENKAGEWPVSYHGTTRNEFESLSTKGFEATKGVKYSFEKGIYTTPNFELAEKFGQRFQYRGYNYVVILQNRVNPNTLQRLNSGRYQYFLSPNEDDVRPYGICIKRV